MNKVVKSTLLNTMTQVTYRMYAEYGEIRCGKCDTETFGDEF